MSKRAVLEQVLGFVREGDVFMVTKPDRLARSTSDLLALIELLEAQGVGLVIFSMGGQAVDTHFPTGKVMLTMLAAVAAFERDLTLQR